MQRGRSRAFRATLAGLLVFGFAGTTVASAETSTLFLNLNASDPGSYNPSALPGDPLYGKWRSLSTPSIDGTIVGSLTYNAGTGALEFPGGDPSDPEGANSQNSLGYVDMGPGFSNFGEGITIEFEGHFGSANQAWERIFDFGNGDASDNIWVGVFGFDSTNYPNRLAIEIFEGEVGQGYCISADPVLVAAEFAKYVITLDGVSCRMYKDGLQIATRIMNFNTDTWQAVYTAPVSNGSAYTSLPREIERANNYIGRSNWGTDAAFDGAIKYVRIYESAISSEEVEDNAASYTLTYSDQVDGLVSGTAPNSVGGNGLLTLSSNTGNLTKTGHTFRGWATTPNQNVAIVGPYNLAADTTLYPVFTRNVYTVTYQENGGTSVADGSFEHGGTLTFPANPTRAGYTFTGWFDAASGGTARTAASVAEGNADATLNAQWSPNTYTVTYNEQGGSTVPDGSYVFGTTLTFPSPPSRAGYSFAGWFANPTGGSPLTAANVSSGTSDVTLHAQWNPLPAQTVTWNPTTSLLTSQSPATPSVAAQSSGDGSISYAVSNAGATGCTVNETTGQLTYSGVGTCTIRATAGSTASYLTGSTEIAFEIGSTSPAMSLNLGVASGQNVANSRVDFGASGLKSNSPWSLILRSNPQTLESGTFSGSVLSGSALIPSGLSAGWHSITLTGLTPSGETLSHAIWFEVNALGALVQTSPSEPVANATSRQSSSTLSSTGGSFLPIGVTAMLLVVAGSVIMVSLRRR